MYPETLKNNKLKTTAITFIFIIIDFASYSDLSTPLSTKLVTQSIKNVLKSTTINLITITPRKHIGITIFSLHYTKTLFVKIKNYLIKLCPLNSSPS